MRPDRDGGRSGGAWKKKAAPPKGCIEIMVGSYEEQKQIFIVPVVYFNHPLFAGLLKEAEEEYGFVQNRPFKIPCHVEVFRQVQGEIDREHSGHGHRHGHHLHFVNCFRA